MDNSSNDADPETKNESTANDINKPGADDATGETVEDVIPAVSDVNVASVATDGDTVPVTTDKEVASMNNDDNIAEIAADEKDDNVSAENNVDPVNTDDNVTEITADDTVENVTAVDNVNPVNTNDDVTDKTVDDNEENVTSEDNVNPVNTNDNVTEFTADDIVENLTAVDNVDPVNTDDRVAEGSIDDNIANVTAVEKSDVANDNVDPVSATANDNEDPDVAVANVEPGSAVENIEAPAAEEVQEPTTSDVNSADVMTDDVTAVTADKDDATGKSKDDVTPIATDEETPDVNHDDDNTAIRDAASVKEDLSTNTSAKVITNAEEDIVQVISHENKVPVTANDSDIVPVAHDGVDKENILEKDLGDTEPQEDKKISESRVSTATAKSGVSLMDEVIVPTGALNLTWVYGMSQDVGLINLSDTLRKIVAYTCANTVVLYDYESNKQRLLQGHQNTVSCTTASADKRWVASADRGFANSIIIWDTYTGIPVQTIYDPYPDVGCSAISISADAKYLATISAGEVQIVSVWDWTVQTNAPICQATLSKEHSQQHYMIFHPTDFSQMISNSERQVIFYQWTMDELKVYTPPLTDQDFWRVVGDYTMSIFQDGTTKALTATLTGNLVVWDNNTINGAPNLNPGPDKRAIKIVNIQENRGITVLTHTDNYVVIADLNGTIKFYDNLLRVCNWYQKFDIGPINSLSFKYDPTFDSKEKHQGVFTFDATLQARDFIVRDFMFATTNSVFANVTVDGTKLDIILSEHDDEVRGIAAHPSSQHLAVGSYSGILRVWDYSKKTIINNRNFRSEQIHTLAYDPLGEFLAVGFVSGTLRLVDTLTLTDELRFLYTYAKACLTHISFAHDSSYLATGDAGKTISLYKAVSGKKGPFQFIARFRSHYKDICGLEFGIALDTDVSRLMSLGKDRMLVEYDLSSTTTDNLVVLSKDKIEQSGVPSFLAWHPPIVKEDFILIGNDQYKLKLFNSTTKMCRKTALGPTYGTTLEKVEVLPNRDDPLSPLRYMAYITQDKIGLCRIPLDGNPHGAMATIAHPGGVANLAVSHDGKHIFTAGGLDLSVSMWNVCLPALEAQYKLGGEDLIPFYGLLPGGREGHIFRELEDYFYYAMLRTQGIDCMDNREVTTKVALTEVPFIMRSLGHYPSQQEITEIINEVKFSKYVDTGEYESEINIGDFLKLYINHRPAFGLNPNVLVDAFDKIGRQLGLQGDSQDAVIQRGDLLDVLQSHGEMFTEKEAAEYLIALLGNSPLGGSYEIAEYDASSEAELIEENMPDEMTVFDFSKDILGFNLKLPQKQASPPPTRRSGTERSLIKSKISK